MMTFQQAKDRLKEVVKGYHSIEFELTEYDNGRLDPKCSIYDGYDWYSGNTWEEAFAKRKNTHGCVPIETITAQQPQGVA